MPLYMSLLCSFHFILHDVICCVTIPKVTRFNQSMIQPPVTHPPPIIMSFFLDKNGLKIFNFKYLQKKLLLCIEAWDT